MAKFASAEWVKAFKDNINASEAYATAAKDWVGDFVFVVAPDARDGETLAFWVDLKNGKCNAAEVVPDPAKKASAYVLTGNYANWKAVAERKVAPVAAIIGNKLKLKGDMGKVMKAVKSMEELVNCVIKTKTDW